MPYCLNDTRHRLDAFLNSDHHGGNNQMTKATLLVLVIAASFFAGFAFRTMVTQRQETREMKKVTGIGGIFFKCKDPHALKEWYQKHLGLNTSKYGAVFEWYQGADSTKKGFTTWSPFKETTKYFEPSTKDFMINYRVDDLIALEGELRKSGVTILDTISIYSYGKFVHVLDAEGNKIELWEPNDIAYGKLGEQLRSKTTK